MPASARLAADRINFRDAEANALLQLVVDQSNRGEAEFQCTNGANGTKVSIRGIAIPTQDDGIASKAYVDSVASGLDMKGQVDYICHGSLMKGAETYAYDPTSQTFTMTGVGSWENIGSDQIDIPPGAGTDGPIIQTIGDAVTDGWFGHLNHDGEHVFFHAKPLEFYYEETAGDASTATTNYGIRRDWPTRILVNGETNSKYNGIYWLKDLGETGNWQLVRSSNFDGNPNGEVKAGSFVFVADGYKFANKGFVLIQDYDDPTSGGFSLTTDGTDGNLINFDGFSAAVFPHQGANIVITGDNIATSLTPVFTNVQASTIQIAIAAENAITCTSNDGVHFSGTKVTVDNNIRCASTISSQNGYEVRASSENAQVKFSVNQNGLTDIHGITHIRGEHLKLHDADIFVEDNTNNTTTMFSVTHAEGNVFCKGTLTAENDVTLANSTGKALLFLDNAYTDPVTSAVAPALNLYGHVKVVKSDDSVLFDVAMNTGDTTIKGITVIKSDLRVKSGTVDKFTVLGSSGNIMTKGTLQCFAGTDTAVPAFTINENQVSPLDNNLINYTSDKDFDIRNATEATILKIHPGTGPKMTMHENAVFEMYNTTGASGTKTFQVNGATGETKLLGTSANLFVGSKFKVYANTGNIDADGTLTVNSTTTVETGDVIVTAGSIRVGTENLPRLVVYKTSNTDDNISTFRGDGKFEVVSSNGSARFEIKGDDGTTVLKKGSTLALENASDAKHWEVNENGHTTTYGGNITVKNVTGNSAVDKFTVTASTGNTVIEGTTNAVGELQADAGIFETSCDFRVSLDGDNTDHVFGNLTKFYQMTNTSTTFKTADYVHNYKTADNTVRYSLTQSGDEMTQEFNSGRILMKSAPGTSQHTIFDMNATPTGLASPLPATMTVCANTTFTKFDGSDTASIASATGNIMTRGEFRMYEGTNIPEVTKTVIMPNGDATFNGIHTITGNTTLKNNSNFTIETGQFKMLGTGGDADNPKYAITNGGATTQLGTLTVHNATLDSPVNVFTVNMSGGMVAAGTLSAADAKFSVNTSGNITTLGTLDVTSTSSLRGTVLVIGSDVNGDAETKCSIDTSGNIDTLGTLDVDGLATFSAASGANAVIVENGDVKFKYDSVNDQYKVSFTASELMALTYPGQSMVLQESVAAGACIEMTTANSAGPSPTVPSLVMHKGASLTVKESATSDFFKVDATARTVEIRSAQTTYLQIHNTASVHFRVSQVGVLQSMGGIELYASSPNGHPFDTSVTVDGDAVPKFSVDNQNGNTVVKGTLDVTNKMTVTDGDVQVTVGLVDVQNQRFFVPKSAADANLASFKGDEAVVVMSNAGVSKWKVTGSSGTVHMLDGSSLVLRSGQSASYDKITLDGSNANITMASTGTFNIGADNFKVVGTYGNTTCKGTMDVHKKLTLKTTEGSIEVENGDLQVRQIGTNHKFEVASGVLAKFLQANGANELLSVAYDNGDNSSTTKFSVSGQHGHTNIHGGNFSITQNDVTKVLFRVHQTEEASVRIMGMSNTTSFVIRNQADTEDKFKVTANSGALVHKGLFTHSADTLLCHSKFEISTLTDESDNRKFVINYENDVADTDMNKFIKIFADTNNIVLGGVDEVLKMTIGVDTGLITSSGDLVLRNALGATGVNKCTITASTGSIVTSGSVTMTSSGTFKIQNDSTLPSITKFEVVGSSGNVSTEGFIAVNTNKWKVLADGSVYQRHNLEIGDGTNVKFQVLANGNATINGGYFRVMNAVGTTQIFKVCQPDQQNAGGSIEFAGNLALDGELKIGTINNDPAFHIESDGDTTIRGGDITQYDASANKVFELLSGQTDMRMYGTATVTGAFTGGSSGQFTGNISAANMLVSSDERLKHRITEIDGSHAINMCSKMQAYNFEWRDTFKYGEGLHFGFIAQKIINVHPALVRTTDDGFYKVNYDIVCALTTTAITELQSQVKSLQDEIATLKSVSALADEIAKLKAQMADLQAAGLKALSNVEQSSEGDESTACIVT